jgi:hypothetical protein
MGNSRKYEFSINLNHKSEENLTKNVDLTFSDIEKHVTNFRDYNSIQRQEGELGDVFHIKFDSFMMAVGAPFLKIDFQGSRNEIFDLIDMLSDVLEEFSEKDISLRYTGNVSLNGQANHEEKILDHIESPIKDYETISALALELEREDQVFGVSINESDGESCYFNIAYGFDMEEDNEEGIELEELMELMFDVLNEVEENLEEDE